MLTSTQIEPKFTLYNLMKSNENYFSSFPSKIKVITVFISQVFAGNETMTPSVSFRQVDMVKDGKCAPFNGKILEARELHLLA